MKNTLGVIECLKNLLRIIPTPSRKRLKVYLLATVSLSLFESLVLVMATLFVTAITNPTAIKETELFQFAATMIPQMNTLQPKELIAWLTVIVIALVAGKNIYRGFIQYHYNRFLGYLSGFLAETLLGRIISAPYSKTMGINSAKLICSVTWTTHCSTLLNSLFLVITESLLLLFMLSVLLWKNPTISCLAFACLGIPSILIILFIKPKIDSYAKNEAAHRRSAYLKLLMALHGLKDVKTNCQELSFQKKFADDAYKAPALKATQDLFVSVPGLALETFGFLLLGLSVVTMYFLLDSSSTEIVGTLTLLAITAWRGLPAAIRTLNSITQLRSSLPYINDTIERYEAFMETRPDVQDTHTPAPVFQQHFGVSNLNFRYDIHSPLVLEDINIDIHKGEFVGIVGQSGAGKSTLVDILIGLVPPSDGALVLDKTPIQGQKIQGWRKQIGYVPQSPYIYDATLAENIAFGRTGNEIDMERVQLACDQAGVSEFINTLDGGLSASIGERGIRLSGGQQQRVCIARALYDTPQLLIFDEATSSLDTKSERLIQQTVLALKGKLTMILVAHRLSTVEQCDKIIWIENGRLKSIGPPEHILPKYRKTLKLDEI